MHACSVITEESCRASSRGGRGSTPSVGARGSVGAVEARRASTDGAGGDRRRGSRMGSVGDFAPELVAISARALADFRRKSTSGKAVDGSWSEAAARDPRATGATSVSSCGTGVERRRAASLLSSCGATSPPPSSSVPTPMSPSPLAAAAAASTKRRLSSRRSSATAGGRTSPELSNGGRVSPSVIEARRASTGSARGEARDEILVSNQL